MHRLQGSPVLCLKMKWEMSLTSQANALTTGQVPTCVHACLFKGACEVLAADQTLQSTGVEAGYNSCLQVLTRARVLLTIFNAQVCFSSVHTAQQTQPAALGLVNWVVIDCGKKNLSLFKKWHPTLLSNDCRISFLFQKGGQSSGLSSSFVDSYFWTYSWNHTLTLMIRVTFGKKKWKGERERNKREK